MRAWFEMKEAANSGGPNTLSKRYLPTIKRCTVIFGLYERGYDRQADGHRNSHSPNVNPHKSTSTAVCPPTRSWGISFAGGVGNL
jgi:hypothetical protein